jgi:hypothetical protein
MGKEDAALDALLQGVDRYQELSEGETYGTQDELQSLYQEILTHLAEDYGIEEETAMELNTLDSEAYSRQVYAIINGTFTEEKDTTDEPAETMKDILPEEEDIISTKGAF